MENQAPYLKQFLNDTRLKLYEEIEEIRREQLNYGLDVNEELKLAIAEAKLDLVKQTIQICETRKRY